MPLLNDLNQLVTHRILEEKSHYTQMYRTYVEKTNIESFEDILTFLYQDMPWRENHTKHSLHGLYEYIANIVAEIITTKERELWIGNYWKKPHISRFVRYLNRTRADVITFNYDTVLEELAMRFLRPQTLTLPKNGEDSLEKISKIVCTLDIHNSHTSSTNKIGFVLNESKDVLTVYFHDYDFSEQDLNKTFKKPIINTQEFLSNKDLIHLKNALFARIHRPPLNYLDFYHPRLSRLSSRSDSIYGGNPHETFRLRKLHGSLNWHYATSSLESANQIYVSENRENEKPLLAGVNPLIIPPVLDKSAFMTQNTLRNMWRETGCLLSQTKKLYIIGYSIPKADLTVQFMLRSNLSSECKIVIVNKDIERKKEFYGMFFDVNSRYMQNDDNIFHEFVTSMIPE